MNQATEQQFEETRTAGSRPVRRCNRQAVGGSEIARYFVHYADE